MPQSTTSNRRLISFEDDILEDVYNKCGGKYTKQEIQGIYRATLSYAIDQLRFSDKISVAIPPLGHFECNLYQMQSRLKKLYKTRKRKNYTLAPHFKKEVEMLEYKIGLLEKEKAARKDKKHAIRFRSMKHYRYALKRQMPLDLLEDYQNAEFK